MRTILFSLIYMMLSIASANSGLVIDEQSLSQFMLNQRDPLFYSENILPAGSTSSLCGPTSVMNWLQLRNQNGYTKNQLVGFVKVIGDDLRNQGIEIKNGLTELQLLEFLKIYNSYLEQNSQYVLKNSKEFELADLFSDTPQLLMLRYKEPVRFVPGGPRRDAPDLRVPIYGNHYVLKIGGDSANAEISFIDPENPEYISKATVEQVKENGIKVYRLRSRSKQDLAAFAFGVPLVWSVTGIIIEQF